MRYVCLLVCLFSASLSIAQNVPRSSHVWMVNLENHSYEDVVGNSQMPYYNSLIQQYGLATQFYSDQHSSLPALMWFVAGAAVETNNSTVSCQHSQDNVIRELLKQGYNWRSYQVNMPSAGYQGLTYQPPAPLGEYYRRHNPLIDFTDVCPGTGQDTNSVPFTQMATDFAQIGTVNYAFVTPDGMDDGEDGTLQQVDEWLENNVPNILARPEFGAGGDGILFIVWDESEGSDDRCSATVTTGCGGRTAALVIGPQVKAGYQSTITYKNENVLATVCAAMGLSPCPGAAQTAVPMSDFFQTAASEPPAGVVIAYPANGATVTGEVHLLASASESQTVSQTQVWDNGVKLGFYGQQIDQIYNLKAGQHKTTVLDLDSTYKIIHEAAITYNVQALVNAVQIVAPVPNQTLTNTTVHVVAQAKESVSVSQMQVWDNGKKLGWYSGTSVNQYYSLTPGSHAITVLDLDSHYDVLHESTVAYSVQ